MGLFYTTFTTLGPDATAVSAALKKLRRAAFVSPTVEAYTVVYDQKTEEQDFTEIEKLGVELSKACGAPVLAAALHDDDVLYLWCSRVASKKTSIIHCRSILILTLSRDHPKAETANCFVRRLGTPERRSVLRSSFAPTCWTTSCRRSLASSKGIRHLSKSWECQLLPPGSAAETRPRTSPARSVGFRGVGTPLANQTRSFDP